MAILTPYIQLHDKLGGTPDEDGTWVLESGPGSQGYFHLLQQNPVVIIPGANYSYDITTPLGAVGEWDLNVAIDDGLTAAGDYVFRYTTAGIGSTIYDPASVTGLVAWYNGDSFDDGTNLWSDISGNGNHTTGVIGTPDILVTINNFPSVNFFGTDSCYRTALTETDSTNDYTVFVFASCYNTLNEAMTVWGTGDTASNSTGTVMAMVAGTTGGSPTGLAGISYQNGTVGEVDIGSPYLTAGQWYCLRMTHDASEDQVESWVDGVSQGTATAPAGTSYTNSRMIIGGSSKIITYDFTRTDIAEVLIYDSILSADDAAVVENYLKWKYFDDINTEGMCVDTSRVTFTVTSPTSVNATNQYLDICDCSNYGAGGNTVTTLCL